MDDGKMQERIADAVRAVRQAHPLVGSVTNGVTTDFVANAQLAVGGSAAMVYLSDEAAYLVEGSGAFYVNMGTLLPVHEQTIPTAAQRASELGRPWVLDPVAIGIGELRSRLIAGLKEHKPTIIRGNASEVMALAGLWGLVGDRSQLARVRGVDSTDEVASAREAAVALARWTGGAVAVSGEEDLVCDGARVARSFGGSALMEKVTGFGCSLGGVMAVYAAAADPFTAALSAVSHYNFAGSRAAAQAQAPASFKAAFIDALYEATPEEVAATRFTLEEAR